MFKKIIIFYIYANLLFAQTYFPGGVLVGDPKDGDLDPNARLEVRGKGGVLIPSMSEPEIASMTGVKAGSIVYDSDADDLQIKDSVNWYRIKSWKAIAPVVGVTYPVGSVLKDSQGKIYEVKTRRVFSSILDGLFDGDYDFISPSDMTTALLEGGVITFNGSSFDVTAGRGLIVKNNNTSYPDYSLKVTFLAATNLALPSTDWNVVTVDSTGVVKIEPGTATSDTYSSSLVLGMINGEDNTVVPLKGSFLDHGNSIRDFFLLVGTIKSGFLFGGLDNNNIYMNSGKLHYQGISPNTENPNIRNCPPLNPVRYKLYDRTTLLGDTAFINSTVWDNNGVITNLTGTNWGYYNVYLNPDCTISAQYGQYTEPSLLALQTTVEKNYVNFILNPNLAEEQTQYVAIIYFQNNAVDFADTNVVKIQNSGLFGIGPAGVGGAAIPGDVLGPGSATNNAVTRFSGGSGKVIKNSSLITDDLGTKLGLGKTPLRTLDIVGQSNAGVKLEQFSFTGTDAGSFHSGITLKEKNTAPIFGVGYAASDTLAVNWHDGLSTYKKIFSVNQDISEISSKLKIGAYTMPATDGQIGQVLKTDGSGSLIWSFDTVATMPVGTIFSTGALTCPVNTLSADGTAVSRTVYSELYAVIGNTWGTGNGTTTFNLPDLRDKFIRGSSGTRAVGTAEAQSTARPTIAFTADSQGNHTHTNSGSTNAGTAHNHGAGTYTASAGGVHSHTASGTTATAGAHVHTWNGWWGSNNTGQSEHNRSRNKSAGDPTDVTTNSGGDHNHPFSAITTDSPAHTHSVTGASATEAAHTHTFTQPTGSAGAHVHSITGGGDAETRPASKIVKYCIAFTTANTQALGDVVGPGLSTINRPALFDNTTGTLLKEAQYTLPPLDGPANYILKTNGAGAVTWQEDTGAGAAGNVFGPATAVTDTVAVYANGTGKLLKNSSIGYLDYASTSIPTHTQGRVYADSISKALTYQSEIADSPLEIGQKTWMRVRNNYGSPIVKGTVVYFNSALNNLPTIAPALANTPITTTLAVTAHAMNNNTDGYAIVFGVLQGVNTSTYASGATLYLSPTVLGGLTATKPASNAVRVGRVLFPHLTAGIIHIDIQDFSTLGPSTTTADTVALFADTSGSSLKQTDYKLPVASCPNGQVLKSDGTNFSCSADVGFVNSITSVGTFPAVNRIVVSADNIRAATSTGYTIPTTVCPAGKMFKSDGVNMVCGEDNGSPAIVGTIFSYGAANCPTDSLATDGSAVDRTTYSDLFGAIGVTWGAGNGSTTFNLPDLRDRFIRGAGAGRAVGTTEAQMTARPTTAFVTDNPSVNHSHPVSITSGVNSVSHTHTGSGTSSAAGAAGWTGLNGTGFPDGAADSTTAGTAASYPRQSQNIGTHTHTYSFTTASQSANHTHAVSGNTGTVSAWHTHTITTGGDAETRPINKVVTFCIVYRQGGSAIGDVLGPASSATNTVALFADDTGKQLGRTAYAVPTTSCPIGEILKSDGTDFTCQPDLIAAATAGDVQGPTASIDNTLAIFDGITGKKIKDSIVLIDNIPTMGSNGVMDNIVVSAADDKTLKDSGIAYTNLVTRTTNFTGLHKVVLTNGINKTLAEASFAIPETPCADGEILRSNGFDYVCSTTTSGDVIGPTSATDRHIALFDGASGKLLKEGIDSETLITKNTNFVAPDRLVLSAGTNKVIKEANYGLPTNVCPDKQILKSNGTTYTCQKDTGSVDSVGLTNPGNITIYVDTSGKEIEDSQVKITDVIVANTDFAGADRVVMTTGANKILGQSNFTIPNTICAADQVLKSDGFNFICAADSLGGTGDVKGPIGSAVDNIAVFSDGSGKLIKDSTINSKNLITTIADFTGANYVALTSGPNKEIVQTNYTIPLLICPQNEVLKSDGINLVCAADIVGGDVSGGIASVIGAVALYSDITGKKIGASNYKFPTSSCADGEVLRSDGTDFNCSVTSYGTLVGPGSSATNTVALFADDTGGNITATPYTLPNVSCAVDEILKSDGTNFVCAADGGGSGGGIGAWTNCTLAGTYAGSCRVRIENTTIARVSFNITNATATISNGLICTCPSSNPLIPVSGRTLNKEEGVGDAIYRSNGEIVLKNQPNLTDTVSGDISYPLN